MAISINSILAKHINSKFLILLNEKTGKYKISFNTNDINSHPDNVMTLAAVGTDCLSAGENGKFVVIPFDNILKINVNSL